MSYKQERKFKQDIINQLADHDYWNNVLSEEELAKIYPYSTTKHWDHEDNTNEMVNWLKDNNIQFRTFVNDEANTTVFFFMNGEGATLFKLMWG